MKFERSLQEKELNLIDFQLNQLNKTAKNQIRYFAILTLIILGAMLIAYFYISPRNINVLFLISAIYLGIIVWVIAERRTKLSRRRKSIAYLKARNLLTVVEVNSDSFYLLDEEDDEGVYYLYQLQNNKVFSFGGQDFYESDVFPSNKFEIVEGRGIKNEILILETFVHGEKIKPKRTISGKDKWDLLTSSHYPDPAKLTVADGRIEDFIK